MIAIPSPDGRSAKLSVRSGEDTFRGGKGKDDKCATNKGNWSRGGKCVNSSKCGNSRSICKSTFIKGKSDNLKQRLVSGHWEEDCPHADVDLLQVKRGAPETFPVGAAVSQAWSVETWIVAPSTQTAQTLLRLWTSRGLQESTNLHGCHHDHARRSCDSCFRRCV